MIKWRTAFVIAVRGTPRTGLPPRSFGRRRLVDKMGLDATKPKKKGTFPLYHRAYTGRRSFSYGVYFSQKVIIKNKYS
jgi:hypothetical protein